MAQITSQQWRIGDVATEVVWQDGRIVYSGVAGPVEAEVIPSETQRPQLFFLRLGPARFEDANRRAREAEARRVKREEAASQARRQKRSHQGSVA